MSAQLRFQFLDQLEGKIYRQQPGRKTFSCHIDKRACFVKLHYGIGWKEIIKNLLQARLPILGAKTEARAIQKLTALNIPTMTLVEWGKYGYNPATQHSFLITEALQDTISLEDFCAPWKKAPPSLKLKHRLIKEVASMAQKLHANGINHRDFYLCHFLLDLAAYKNNQLRLSLIDLHRMQIRAKVPQRWQIKDIAGLYFSAMRIGLSPRDRLYFMSIYRKHPAFKKINFKHFWRLVEQKALALYEKTYFQVQSHFSMRIIHEKSAPLTPWQTFISAPSHLIDSSEIIKHDHTTTLAIIKLQQEDVLIKRYNVKNFWKLIARLLTRSRAYNSWQAAEYLGQLNIKTPKPLLMLEERLAFLSYRSYFAMELLPGKNLLAFIEDAPKEKQLYYIEQACSIIKTLSSLGISHGDLKATNWFVSDNCLYLLDLDSFRIASSPQKLAKDKQRFLKNWQNHPFLFTFAKQLLEHK